MEQVLRYVRVLGRPVVLKPADAPRIQTAAMLNGITLPLLAIRAAIEKLTRPNETPAGLLPKTTGTRR